MAEGAGQSAQARAEAQRAKAQRLLASADRWERGAQGEAAVAATLARLPPLFTVLHDLQVPDSRANIDHLVIGPAGVFVVDAKRYSQQLRVAGGMIWRGRHSIQKELDTVAWEASKAAAVLGVPVNAVLCFVGSSLPEPTTDIAGVRVTTDAHLVGAITAGTAGYTISDISRVTILANRHLPAVTVAANNSRRPTKRQDTTAAQPRKVRQRQSNQPRKARRGGSLIGAVAMLAVAGLLLRYPAASSGVLSGLTERILASVLPETSDAATVTEAPLAINGDFSCSAPGTGWTLTFQWPGDGPAGGYTLATSADQAAWTPLASWSSAAQAAPHLGAIQPDSTVHVQLAAAADAGATTVGTFRSPTSSC